jgi:hypothetical protein
LYKNKVASRAGNDEVVPFEHASRIEPPDGVAGGVSGMVTPAPFYGANTDVRCTLEL